MTITYHAGGRIQGLSTDTKPTDVPTTSRFEETDTRKIYYSDGSGWTELGQTLLYTKDTWYEHLTGESP